MTEPTAKHREEAGKLVESVFGKRGSSPIYATAGRLFDELETKFDATLSSRDAEIREVLEGLRGLQGSRNCWCDADADDDHYLACLAARGLWNRLQS